MELTQALQEKIAEHMPAMVAGELKDFIARAQETEKELERTRASLRHVEGLHKTAQEQLTAHRNLDHKLQELEARERELQGRELQVRFDVAHNRAAVAEGKLEVLQGMMETVFRNTEVRRKVFETVPVAVDGSPGDPARGVYPTPGHVQSHQRTTETSEEKV
jgi:hypothetical protein